MNADPTYPPQSERCRRLKYTILFFGITLVLVLLAVLLTRCAVKTKTAQSPVVALSTYGLEIPVVDDPEFLLVCEEGRYTLWYDTIYRQARWAAHVLTRSDVESENAKRRNNFTVCPAARSKGWAYARDRDYTNTGYDRGHLVPSADRVTSQAENDATFRLSNIAPQTARLNRVVWNNLEAEVRRMAGRLDTLWIVTGGELKPGLERIGTSGIGVPESFFKVLLARSEGRFMAVAFVIPNAEKIAGTFWDYAVTVDEAEELLGIDFFPILPDDLEQRVEAHFQPEQWKR